jgi:UDPglucose 6-dehydrogenase
MRRPVIGFAGMTHLGLSSAVAAADKGFDTVAFDPDAASIAAIARGEMPVAEPDLELVAAGCGNRLNFTTDATALTACDVVYVAPDVPTDAEGRSDLSSVEALFQLVDRTARPDAVVVVLSQVPPGFTRARQRAGRTLHYQVETLIFGRAMERARRPERFIVGCADPAAPLPTAFRQFLDAFGCPILPMGLESAELAKISINVCLAASVSVANTMAELCEQSGADWSEIVPALRLDRRIGGHAYLAPGLGIGGGNLGRDLATVGELADRAGTDASVVRAFLANSAHRRDWTWRTLEARVLSGRPDARIGVLGLAYKVDTHSTKGSPALALLAHLAGYRVSVFDPVVPGTAAGPSVVAAGSALEAVDDADVVCVMTPWREFAQLPLGEMARRMRGRVLIDPFAVFDRAAVRAAGYEHLSLGVGDRPQAATAC